MPTHIDLYLPGGFINVLHIIGGRYGQIHIAYISRNDIARIQRKVTLPKRAQITVAVLDEFILVIGLRYARTVKRSLQLALINRSIYRGIQLHTGGCSAVAVYDYIITAGIGIAIGIGELNLAVHRYLLVRTNIGIPCRAAAIDKNSRRIGTLVKAHLD